MSRSARPTQATSAPATVAATSVATTTSTSDAISTVRFTTPAAGPMFDGHFPGQPIVPGARLLDLIVAAIGVDRAFDVPQAKFVEPVGPATPLVVTWHADETGRLAFDCRTADDRRVAHGTLRPL